MLLIQWTNAPTGNHGSCIISKTNIQFKMMKIPEDSAGMSLKGSDHLSTKQQGCVKGAKNKET